MPTLEDLGNQIKAQYPQAYGSKDALDLGRRAKAKYPAKYAAYTESAKKGPSALKTGLDLLPAVGGLVGGAVGGAGGTLFGLGVGGVPGAIGGAAAGGAGGEALKQLAEHALTGLGAQGVEGPQSSGSAAASIGREGAVQGALEATGQGVFAAGKAVARPVYELATRATPEVAKAALKEGITATSKGLERISNRIAGAADATRRLVTSATNYGTRYDGIALLRNVLGELGPDVTKSLDPAVKRKLQNLARNYVGSQPWTMTPTRLHRMKQLADDAAKPIYEALDRGEYVPPTQKITAAFQKAFADHARDLMDLTINGYKESNARAQSLIKIKNTIWPAAKEGESALAGAFRRAARPAGGAAVGATVGAISSPEHTRGALIGGAIGGALGTPAVSTSIATGLHSPILQAALRRAPHYAQLLTQLGNDSQ